MAIFGLVMSLFGVYMYFTTVLKVELFEPVNVSIRPGNEEECTPAERNPRIIYDETCDL